MTVATVAETDNEPVADGRVAGGDGRAHQVRDYDFRQREALDRNHVRALNAALDTFGLLLGNMLSATLRTPARTSVASLEQLNWESFAASVEDVAAITLFSLEPLPGRALLHLPLELAMLMVDLRLGGPGADRYSRRPLSEIEQSIVATINERLLGQLVIALGSIAPLSVEGVQSEHTLQTVQLAWPHEMCLAVRIDIELTEDRSFRVALCIPFPALRPLVEMLDAVNKPRGDRSDDVPPSFWRLMDVPIDVRVRFNPVSLTSEDILSLAPGDVVRLHHDQQRPLDVVAGGVPLRRATPTQRGKRIACVVVDPPEEPS